MTKLKKTGKNYVLNHVLDSLSNLLTKYFPNSVASAKGHKEQVRKHIRSTKTTDGEDPEYTPINKIGYITNIKFTIIEIIGTTGKIYTDQT